VEKKHAGDRIEAKWIDAFSEIFERCASNRRHAVFSRNAVPRANVHLAELALFADGARGRFTVIVPSRAIASCDPLDRASEAIHVAPVVTALQQAGFVVIAPIEGLKCIGRDARDSESRARILVISNEHPEAPKRMVAPHIEQRPAEDAWLLRAARQRCSSQRLVIAAPHASIVARSGCSFEITRMRAPAFRNLGVSTACITFDGCNRHEARLLQGGD